MRRNGSDSFKKIVIVNGKKQWRIDEVFVIMGIKHLLLNVDSWSFRDSM